MSNFQDTFNKTASVLRNSLRAGYSCLEVRHGRRIIKYIKTLYFCSMLSWNWYVYSYRTSREVGSKRAFSIHFEGNYLETLIDITVAKITFETQTSLFPNSKHGKTRIREKNSSNNFFSKIYFLKKSHCAKSVRFAFSSLKTSEKLKGKNH